MNTNKHYVLIIADIITILIFIFSSVAHINEFAVYQIGPSPMYYIVLPSVFLLIFLILRILKSLSVVFGKQENIMVSPVSASVITLIGAMFMIKGLSDIPFAAYLFIPFSFIFSRSLYKNIDHKSIKKIMWSVFTIIPIAIYLSVDWDNTSSESAGYAWLFILGTIFGLSVFGVLVNMLLDRQERLRKV